MSKVSHITELYQANFALLLDLYHLTMANGFWKTGLYRKRAVFHVSYREDPFDDHYAISAGLHLAIDLVQNFRFTADDIQYLGGLTGNDGRPLFDEGFLNHLQRMTFDCHIDAAPEGTIVRANAPLLRVEGPLIQAQILEAALINVINYSTLVATKSARMVRAAAGDPILEFGLRRAQGVDGAITASRAAYIGGCHATSNVMAGRFYGIPVKGTHAHSWVMCFADELTSFREYARVMPNNSIFLVDTYDTIEGIKNAIKVGLEMKKSGHQMVGIRLDSGDMADLSIRARQMLDEAGLEEAQIVVSDNMDEYRIRELKERGAVIGVWGIGSRLVTAYEQPVLGGIYKLSAIEGEDAGQWNHRIKLSEEPEKISDPGLLQIRRFYDSEGAPVADMLYDLTAGPSHQLRSERTGERLDMEGYEYEDLLKPVFRNGRLVYEAPSIHQIREHSLREQERFAGADWSAYHSGSEERLHQIKQRLIRTYRGESSSA